MLWKLLKNARTRPGSSATAQPLQAPPVWLGGRSQLCPFCLCLPCHRASPCRAESGPGLHAQKKGIVSAPLHPCQSWEQSCIITRRGFSQREPGQTREAHTIAAFAETLSQLYAVPRSSFGVYSLGCSSFLSQQPTHPQLPSFPLPLKGWWSFKHLSELQWEPLKTGFPLLASNLSTNNGFSCWWLTYFFQGLQIAPAYRLAKQLLSLLNLEHRHGLGRVSQHRINLFLFDKSKSINISSCRGKKAFIDEL